MAFNRHSGKFESDFDRSFKWAQRLFMGMCAMVFLIIVGVFVAVGYLGYQCYSSNDPNNMACFMMSGRLEVGVRQR